MTPRLQIVALPGERWGIVLDAMPTLTAEQIRDDWGPVRDAAIVAGAAFVWRFDHDLTVAGGAS